MATRKTKTLADVTAVTTVGDNQYVPLCDSNGGIVRVTPSALVDGAIECATDGDIDALFD